MTTSWLIIDRSVQLLISNLYSVALFFSLSLSLLLFKWSVIPFSYAVLFVSLVMNSCYVCVFYRSFFFFFFVVVVVVVEIELLDLFCIYKVLDLTRILSVY